MTFGQESDILDSKKMNSIGLNRYTPAQVVQTPRHFAIIQDEDVVQFSAEGRLAPSLACFKEHQTLHLDEAVVARTFVEDTS